MYCSFLPFYLFTFSPFYFFTFSKSYFQHFVGYFDDVEFLPFKCNLSLRGAELL